MRDTVSEAIEAQYERNQLFSDHPTLRASEIGNPCERRLWYKLHWVLPPKRWSGRMLRLFQTGHSQEERLIADLRSIGIVVNCQQEAIEPLANGVLSGSIDGEATGIPDAPKTVHLVEIKTHNDANFKLVMRSGVKNAMPKHYAQCQSYMAGRGLTRALYVALNKNTDQIYCERIEYDAVAIAQIEAKATRIHTSKIPPSRLSDKPDFWECKICDFHGVCHGDNLPRKNCRTCIYSTIVDDRIVHCSFFEDIVDYDAQNIQCKHHLYIPKLINGEQIEADETKQTITYRLKDGSIYVNEKGLNS